MGMATPMENFDQQLAARGCAADYYLLPLRSTKANTFQPMARSRQSRLVKLLRLLFYISIAISSSALNAYLSTLDFNFTSSPRFQLASAIVFPFHFNRSAGELDAAWDFTMGVDNPNHDSKLYYSDIQGSILYRFLTAGFSDEIRYLGSKAAPSFIQDEKKTTWLRFSVRALQKAVDEAAATDQLFSKTYGGSMQFELSLAARCRYMMVNGETKEETLQVACKTINLDFDVERTGIRTIGSSCEVF